jgi:lipoate-protein ligase A
MAVDAWLLAEGRGPVLRLYTWEPPALSLGWFQRLVDVPAAAGFTPGVDLVRRRTGGGAIHHARELTFSIAAPLDHPLYAGPVADSYVRVHAAIAAALARFGVDAAPRGERSLASDVAGTGMCFHASHPLDLVWEQDGGLRKGVGSAQRRKGGRVVHHGSIKLGRDPLEPGVAVVPGDPDPLDVGRALAAELCGAVPTRPWTDAERARVAERYRPAFADPDAVAAGGRRRQSST